MTSKMSIIHVIYLLLVKSILVHSESFTSTTHLTYLLNTEVELARQLETYLKEEYDRLDRIEKYLFCFSFVSLIIVNKNKDLSMWSKMNSVKHKAMKINILAILSTHIYLSNIWQSIGMLSKKSHQLVDIDFLEKKTVPKSNSHRYIKNNGR